MSEFYRQTGQVQGLEEEFIFLCQNVQKISERMSVLEDCIKELEDISWSLGKDIK